jgi:DNA (cytosine-5)-methyltransferase 1
MASNSKPTVIDIFAGCGGMSWGLQKEGFRVLCGVDLDEIALSAFANNFPAARSIKANIENYSPQDLMRELGLKPEELDCLIGGPPCQGFSKNVPASRRFLDDPQNLLVRRFIEFVIHLRPKVFIMENVAEVVNAYDQAYTREIRETLAKYGYEVDVKVLFAPDYGIPQRRRRAFYFGSQSGKQIYFPSPSHLKERNNHSLFGESYVTVWDAIGDLPSLKHGEGESPTEYTRRPQHQFQERMRRDAGKLYDHVARELRPKQLARLSSLKAGEDARHLPKELAPKSGYSGAYGRLSKDSIAPTITRWVFHPGSGRFGHPEDYRVITIREAARLQSFSDDFVFTGTYIQKSHQVGNAVPPLFLSSFASEIRKHLS